MALLTLTTEQRAYALERTAEARRVRGELLAELRSGGTSLAEALVRVSVLLRALPGFGPARVAALMATCGVAENGRVGGLGEQQCRRLLEAVAF